MILEIKQTQKLLPVLTQQLQQAIKLLQLSRIELIEAIELELEENPILELKEEGPADNSERVTDDVAESNTEDESDDIREWLDRYSPSEGGGNIEDGEAPDYENIVRKTTNLRDYIRWQVGLSDFDEHERFVAEWIIGNIDDNGYVAYPISEIEEVSGCSAEDLEKTLKKIQRLDPPGVGARDLRECMLLQYKAQGGTDPLFEEVVMSHLDLLQKQNFKEIAKRTGQSIDSIKDIHTILKGLDPKPGRNFSDDYTAYLVPDVYVVKGKDGFDVYLNDEEIPELRMNRYYTELSTDKKVDGDTKKYIKDKIKQARWFVKSIEQRQKTLYRVARSIVDFQEGFFHKGVKYLKPLVLRDVAQEVGIHESTVSRVTTNKYMSTPHGIYEMKFFFSSGISGGSAGSTSANAVMEFISEIIEKEDKRKPLADDEIVLTLKKDYGVEIARRTVVKYRDALRIGSSRARKIADS